MVMTLATLNPFCTKRWGCCYGVIRDARFLYVQSCAYIDMTIAILIPFVLNDDGDADSFVMLNSFV